MEGTRGLILLITLVALGLIALIAYSFYNMAVRLRRTESASGAPDNVGFVVDTFHELVAKLKEKEKELERLRLKAEDKASAMEGYNESILQSVPSGVIGIDSSGAVVKANEAAGRILEQSPEELTGRPMSDIIVIPAYPSDGTIKAGETAYRTVSGKDKWLGYSISPLRDAKDGDPIGGLMVITDMTELRAYQSQAELRRRLESLGEVSAGIAHELRNPLGVIAGYMKLIAKRAEPQIQPQVEAVLREVMLMDSIIGDFLSFARPRKLDLSELDLGALIRECTDSALGGRTEDLELNLDLPHSGPFIRADETMLRQAFRNLIQNAVESLGPEPRRIAISAMGAEGGMVEVMISDTGCGMTEEIGDKIFLPFFTTKEKGTGLGLAIAHGAITLHGGTVEIRPGDPSGGRHGTVFVIRLPR